MFQEKAFIKSVPMCFPANSLKGLPVGTFKIASKLNLEKGKKYKGCSYVDMMNKVLLTAVNEGYIKSSYPLDHVGLGEALAWFAFFDGKLRRSGKDGEYFNDFVSDDELLETCVIDNEKEYHKKRSTCRPIRFVFVRHGDYSCHFEGIFYQESINIYKKGDVLIGETILKRYNEWEQYL